MKIKEKIWNKEKRKFTFKGSLIFLALGIVCTIIFMILYFTIDHNNEANAIIFYIFGALQMLFYSFFLITIFEFLC